MSDVNLDAASKRLTTYISLFAEKAAGAGDDSPPWKVFLHAAQQVHDVAQNLKARLEECNKEWQQIAWHREQIVLRERDVEEKVQGAEQTLQQAEEKLKETQGKLDQLDKNRRQHHDEMLQLNSRQMELNEQNAKQRRERQALDEEKARMAKEKEDLARNQSTLEELRKEIESRVRTEMRLEERQTDIQHVTSVLEQQLKPALEKLQNVPAGLQAIERVLDGTGRLHDRLASIEDTTRMTEKEPDRMMDELRAEIVTSVHSGEEDCVNRHAAMSDTLTEDKVLLRTGYLWPISSTHESARIANALDILIIIIRTASSHTTEITYDNNNKTLVQHALEAPVGVPLPSYNELLGTVRRQLQIDPTTVLSDLVEHRLMIETFWDRAEFTRFSRQVYRRVALENNKWQWKGFPLQSGNVAQRSLVEWDGRDDLGHHISRDYRARRTDPLSPVHAGVRSQKDFNDIRTFVVRGSRMRQVDDHLELEVTITTYDIAATVKCSEAGFDRIRLYDMYGRFFPAPMFIRNDRMQEVDCKYFSLDWDVSEPGQYMLFYAKRQEREFPDFRTPAVLLTAHKLMPPSM